MPKSQILHSYFNRVQGNSSLTSYNQEIIGPNNAQNEDSPENQKLKQ